MSGRPLFSIITSSLNSENFIQAAIESIRNQNSESFEHIVVDGGSSDHTCEIVRKQKIQLIQADGTSVYQAWNLGIRSATGEFIIFLNTDDIMPNGTLNFFEQKIASDPSVDILCARGISFSDKLYKPKNVLRGLDSKTFSSKKPKLDNSVINSMCIKRAVFENVGYFDEDYKITADKLFLLKLLGHEHVVIDTDWCAMLMRHHEKSLTFTDSFNEIMIEEGLKVSRLLMTGKLPVANAFSYGVALWRRRTLMSLINAWRKGEMTFDFIRQVLKEDCLYLLWLTGIVMRRPVKSLLANIEVRHFCLVKHHSIAAQLDKWRAIEKLKHNENLSYNN